VTVFELDYSLYPGRGRLGLNPGQKGFQDLTDISDQAEVSPAELAYFTAVNIYMDDFGLRR